MRSSALEELDLDLLISVTGGLGAWGPVKDEEDPQHDPRELIYRRTDDCLECLKDLQRFLRQDNPDTRPAFFALGKFNIAKSDLVPLLTAYPNDTELIFNALKVATFLTMPTYSASDNVTVQVEYMQQVKEAFLSQDALAVVVALVAEPLSRVARMSEQDAQLVQLVITFLRNLLVIQDRSATGGSRGDHKSRLRSELLSCLFDNDVMELLRLLAQHTGQPKLRSEAPLLLEIFSVIFQGLEAKDLHQASLQGPRSQQQRPVQKEGIKNIKGMLEQEKERLQALNRGKGPPRHPRHGGTFVRMDRSQPGTVSIVHSAPTRSSLPTLPCHKPKTKLMMSGDGASGIKQTGLLFRLHGYAEQFLEASYGVLMRALGKQLEAGLGFSRLSRDDFLRFINLVRFFTGFVRLRQEEVMRAKKAAQKENRAEGARQDAVKPGQAAERSPFACISATMGWDTFHMVQILWLGIIDLPPRSKEKDWDLQHSSLSLLKELLLTLDLAQQTGTSSDRSAADRLSRRLLHDDQKESGLLPVLGRLLKGFSHRYQPRIHAAVLVEAIHITLRLLDRLCRQEAGQFLVKRRAQVIRRRKAAFSPPKSHGGTVERHNEGSAEADEPEASPAPAAGSDRSPAGRQDEGGEAMHQGSQSAAKEGGDVREGSAAAVERLDPFEEMEEEEDMEARREQTKEVAFSLNQRVRQELAVPAVIHLYSWLLHGYKTNSPFLNHAIVSFYQRIVSPDALNLEPMLYQLSILRVFQQILSDKSFRSQPNAAELLHFCTGVTRNLFQRMTCQRYAADGRTAEHAAEGVENGMEAQSFSQDAAARQQREDAVKQNVAQMMFVELLFWKNSKEAEDVREEYIWKHVYRVRGASPDRASQDSGAAPRCVQAGNALSSGLEERLRALFEEHGAEKGYLDIIVDKLGEGLSRTRVAKALKALGLKRGVLTDAQKEKLRGLFKEHCKKRGYLDAIVSGMGGSFRKSQISTQLRKLGLRRDKGGRMPSADSESGSDAPDSDSDAGNKQQKKRKKAKADWTDDDSGSEGGEQLPKQPGLGLSGLPMIEMSDEELPGAGASTDASSDDSDDASDGEQEPSAARRPPPIKHSRSPSSPADSTASEPDASSEEVGKQPERSIERDQTSKKRRGGARADGRDDRLVIMQRLQAVRNMAAEKAAPSTEQASPADSGELPAAGVRAAAITGDGSMEESDPAPDAGKASPAAMEEDSPPEPRVVEVPVAGKRRRLTKRAISDTAAAEIQNFDGLEDF